MNASQKKTGFVALAGRSNAGKSTLLNTLVGTKLAITTPKPQTTRYSVQGVLHLPEGQVVFVDSPGILLKKHDRLTDKLNQTARTALKDIDVVLYVVDPTRAIGHEEELIMKLIKSSGTPTILVINKIDDRKARFIEDYRALAPDFTDTVEISALKGTHIKTLLQKITDRLPEGESLYPEGQITNVDEKFWHAELIREKLFMTLRQELPYTTTVEIEKVGVEKTKKGEEILRVEARILTDTDQHKKMIIGKGGQKIKHIGSMVRRELEEINRMKVFVDLEVETDPHWIERLH